MRTSKSSLKSLGSLVCAALSLACWTAVACGQGYTPEHEEVKGMIAKGVKYLLRPGADAGSKWSIGSDMFRAYTVLKALDEHDHPVVKSMAERTVSFASSLNRKGGPPKSEKIVYETAMAAIFLASLDPDKYRPSIMELHDFLVSIQKDSGAFHYLQAGGGPGHGDTSQTQFAALAFWVMKQSKIDVNERSVDALTKFLLTVQLKDGGWVYNYPPQVMFPASHSMLAAGLSGTLVGADVLGVLRGSGSRTVLEGEIDEDEGVPAAFRRVEIRDSNDSLSETSITKLQIQRCAQQVLRWLANKPYHRGVGGDNHSDWYYYWMYSRERYESFLELLSGRREASPRWYNEGVVELKKYQSASGGWGLDDADPSGPEAATCFAILYLLRNTQKTIGNMNSSDSVGGYGLGNVAEVTASDGKLIDRSKVTSIEDAMSILEDKKDDSTAAMLLADRIVLDADPKKRKEQLNRFARLLRGPDYQARRVAAKLLGRGDDLDYVPDLIFALGAGEGDKMVSRIAENSLRILSRQLDTFKLPKEGEIGMKDRVAAEQYWKAWYLSIRPDYVFIDK